MKYAIQASYHMWNKETNSEYDEWMYLGLEGKLRLFVFEEEINEQTKLFDTATEAGKYVDEHFSDVNSRCSYSLVRIVEVQEQNMEK